MLKKINSNTILLISGVSCVGKTTTAYRILQRLSEFRQVSETDIIRAVIRTVINNVENDGIEKVESIRNRYEHLFQSLSFSDYNTSKLQAKQLVPYIKEIVLRQQRRNIPTIIEGAGIIPSIYFPNDTPLYWMNNNMIFLNLYLSNINEHITRREKRFCERNYDFNEEDNKKSVEAIRNNKNELMHCETTNLSNKYRNVYSLDVANHSIDELSDIIIEILVKYYQYYYK